MRTKFPTSLDEGELHEYIEYLIAVGAIFVSVAVLLYIAVIVLAIASKKWISTERIAHWHNLHATKAHFWFIATTLFVSFLVIGSVAFGLIENKHLHERIVKIAAHTTTVIPPAAQVVLNVNDTVANTEGKLNSAIVQVESILDSVAGIMDSISSIYASIMEVQEQFKQMEAQVREATSHLSDATDYLDNLNQYEKAGYISGVPDSSYVQKIDNTINDTLNTASAYLNSTVTTISTVLEQVNTTVADAVHTGTTEVGKAKDTLRTQIGSVESKLAGAVHSLQKPNSTINDLSATAITYEGLRYNILIVVLVFAWVPMLLIFIGLAAKVPMLFKFAFAASFLCMFWLIAIGGVFTIVHTAFSQACDSREILVVNAIHKFTLDEYRVNLGNLNVGSNGTIGKTEIVISLNSTTLHDLLSCVNPTNFFDVFDLENLIGAVFAQIYTALDQLEEEQASLFASNTTNYINVNLNNQLDTTVAGVTGFDNTTKSFNPNDYLNVINGVQDNVANITSQTDGLSNQANNTVDNAFGQLNNVTKNVTTTDGNSFSLIYTINNITSLDPSAYPFNETLPIFQEQLVDVQQQVVQAIANQDNIAQVVTSITTVATTIIGNLGDFQKYLGTTVNISTAWNDSLTEIQGELDSLQLLLPQIYTNISSAISTIRTILSEVAGEFRTDTQCGFAGEFYTTFSEEICVTSTSNAQAMAAALLLMGISYFLVCLLGVGLLKRNDVKKLMHITEAGIKRIASMPAINHTINTIHAVVRAASATWHRTPSATPTSPRTGPKAPRLQEMFFRRTEGDDSSPRSSSLRSRAAPGPSPLASSSRPSTLSVPRSPRTPSLASPLSSSSLEQHTEEASLAAEPTDVELEELPRSPSVPKVTAFVHSLRKDLHRRASSLTNATILPIVAAAARLSGSHEIPYQELEDALPSSLEGPSTDYPNTNSDETDNEPNENDTLQKSRPPNKPSVRDNEDNQM